jgi:hypothetical protein
MDNYGKQGSCFYPKKIPSCPNGLLMGGISPISDGEKDGQLTLPHWFFRECVKSWLFAVDHLDEFGPDMGPKLGIQSNAQGEKEITLILQDGPAQLITGPVDCYLSLL